MRPKLALPPAGFWLVTSPSHAPNWRALANRLKSPTLAVIVEAVVGPMPSSVAAILARSSERTWLAMYFGAHEN